MAPKLFSTMISKIATLTNLDPATATKLSLVVTIGALIASIIYFMYRQDSKLKKDIEHPPFVPSAIPFIGSLLDYGLRPLEFLQENRKQYGDCFTFLMFGKKMTYCLGPEGNNFVFNGKLSHINAEDAYRNLTVPVFGDGVVYDVENSVLMEQKKFFKDAVNTAALKSYVPLIESETKNYFTRWQGDTGKSDISIALAELTIMTASRCLMGKEIRSQLDEKVAQLYHDLDAGFTPLNFLFPNLPLPSYHRRDEAQVKMRNIFLNIMDERKTSGKFEDDILDKFLNATYKNGTKMSERDVAHMMIAILMAGQHTSSTTGSWALLYIAANPDIGRALVDEQRAVYEVGSDTALSSLPPLDFDALKRMTLLENVIKETLRLKSPIHTIMRKVHEDVQFKGLTIPKGHYLCGSPSISQLDPEKYPDPLKFDPYRHVKVQEGDEAGEWSYDMLEKSARSHFLPFGAGRHRCIGESFAYIQLKTIISTFLRTFAVELPVNSKTGLAEFPKPSFTSMIVMPERPSILKYRRI